MGSKDDEMRCVDSEFRVKGISKGLRVVDASVFPRTPGAWPTVPTYMLGKKAADMLAKEYPQCEKKRR
jgi:choline dehydrogenase